MGVIENFVNEYERQFDFWEAAARTAGSLLEAELNSSGVRGIVTSRAKSVDRLEEKLRQRNTDHTYRSIAQISKDIADLAGVRVALYFPGQMDEVERLVRDVFDVKGHKQFPAESAKLERGSRTKHAAPGASRRKTRGERRFSGYGARHFRVLIPAGALGADQVRYSTAIIEVQVASVLMHAWSEVEHDLVYKPREGELSPSEYALLDQLNGLVLAGEIALEQLQHAGDARVAAASTPFRDHYELAEFLRSRLATLGSELTDATLGRVDILFDYLAEQAVATASAVSPYLEQLEQDFEQRPAAAQLADLMLSGDASRYQAYRRAMSASRHPSQSSRARADMLTDEPHSVVVRFIQAWAQLEGLLAARLDLPRQRPSLATSLREARKRDLVNAEEFIELNLMRELRNRIVHDPAADVPVERVTSATQWLHGLIDQLETR